MAVELAYVLINPYTIAKSRTGGVIARVLGRTDLKLVGARVFGPSRELATSYAELVSRADPENAATCNLIANYILERYSPDPETRRPRRVLLLLFEGESAVRKIWAVTGSATQPRFSGATIRDTYGDYILDADGSVRYFEPAVLVGPTVERAARTLRLWARYSATDGGLISHAADVPAGDNIERTLVMLKPDNFRFPSLKPGSIIDVLSSSGLRIVGAKKFSMSVAQAVEFYGPVKAGLEERFEGIAGAHTAELLSREFGFAVPEDEARALCRRLGSRFAGAQFEMIVKFMTGYRPSECPAAEVNQPGREECLALVYQGVNAVTKIRTILGSTDPRKAEPGSVRREFGTDIMVNAAHASDSTASADRELGIVRIEDDPMQKLVEKYYGLTQA